MKRFSKVLVFILAVAMCATAAFALVGCGDANELTITTYTMFGEGDGHRTGWEAAMKEFNNKEIEYVDAEGNTQKVKVKIEDRSKWTNDYDTQVANDLNGSAPSDLIYGFTGARNSGYIAKTVNVSDVKSRLSTIKSGISYAPKGDVAATDLTTAAWKKGFQMGIIYNTANGWNADDVSSVEKFEAKVKAATANAKVADYSSEPNTYFNMYALAELGDKMVSAGNINKAWWEAAGTELKTAIEKTLQIAKDAGFVGASAPETSLEKAAFAKGERGAILEGSWAFAACIKETETSTPLATAKFAQLPSATKYALTGVDHGWQITKKAYDDNDKNYAKLQVIAKLVNWCYTNSQKFVDGGAGGVYLNNNEGTPTAEGVEKDAIESLVGKIAVLPVENRLSTAASAALFKDGIVAAIQGGKTGAAEALAIYNSVLGKFD